MPLMLQSLQYTAQRAAKRAALSTLAGLMMIVGLGFLTTALFLLIASTQGALFATAVIGAIYFGLGLILMAVALPSRRHVPQHPPAMHTTASMIAQVTEGFVTGLNAGRAARR